MAAITIETEVTGSVWQLSCSVGDKVVEEDTLLILESMKMEIPVMAPAAGTVTELLVTEGDEVAEGQAVAVLET